MIDIRIIEPGAIVASVYAGPDNAVFLDLDDGFSLRYTKALQQLTEANNVGQEATLSVNVPATVKNRMILAGKEGVLKVEVFKDLDRLPGDGLEVVRENDKERTIEIEIIGASWLTALSKIQLQKVFIGNFFWDKANIESKWGDPQAFGIAGLANYGGWNTPGQVGLRDFRFWLRAFRMMELTFCAIDWTFESSYYQKAGFNIFLYLLAEKWYSYPDKNDVFRVDLNVASPRNLTGNDEILIFDEVNDPLDLYNNLGPGGRPGECLYPATGEQNIDYRIEIREITVTLNAAPAGQPVPQLNFLFYRNRPPGLEFIGFESFPGPLQGSIKQTFSFTITYESANAGDSFAFFVSYQDDNGNPYPWTLESIDLVFSPDPPYYIEGDAIEMNTLIDPEITGLDLLKALLHLCNGKLDTNYDLRTVSLFPPYNASQYAHNMEGYFKRDQPAIDLTGILEPDSMIKTNNRQIQNRFVDLKFKDSTDAWIDEQSRERELYSRRVDRGDGQAETTKIENELLEPSDEIETTAAEIGTTTGTQPMSLIALQDNRDGRISRAIGPRVAYYYGLIRQQDSAGTVINWNYDGVLREDIPYLSQAPVRPMLSDPDIYPLIFADRQYDFWRLFYRRWLNENLGTQDYEVLLYLDLTGYRSITFRDMIAFFYRENFQYYQPTAVRDFSTNEDVSTIVTLKLIDC